MTTDELNALQPETLIYLPTQWEVVSWLFSAKVPGRDYYTLTHPPDPDGVVSNKRPYYMHVLDLMNATLDKQAAWLSVVEGLNERIDWIYKHELTKANASTSN